MIRVLIADDSIAMRDSIASLLDGISGFRVLGLAGDGLEAVNQASELLPDVVIMDARMPNMDGIEATRHIKQTIPGVGVLLFSTFTDYMEAGIAAGADGYLMKDCDTTELFAELRECFFKHDPIGINRESNQDEYDPEVGTIIPRLSGRHSY